METEEAIYFYDADKKFGYMSNFYMCDFQDEEGTDFCSSEQYFMYMKAITFDSDNEKLIGKILEERNQGNIRKYGRQVKNFDEAKWASVRSDMMLNGIRLKFSQNPELKRQLLSTGTKILYEASKTDKIWGIGYDISNALKVSKDKYALNLLGKTLMKLRSEFLENISSQKNTSKNEMKNPLADKLLEYEKAYRKQMKMTSSGNTVEEIVSKDFSNISKVPTSAKCEACGSQLLIKTTQLRAGDEGSYFRYECSNRSCGKEFRVA